MALHKEEERTCRQLGDPAALAASLANQAGLLGANAADRDEAQRLADEAHSLALRHGLSALAGQIDGLRQAIGNAPRSERARPRADVHWGCAMFERGRVALCGAN